MRAIFVNYSHPDTPHVSGMRVPGFAEAMARRGHQIVLITKTLQDNDFAKPPEQVARDLSCHNWKIPYHIACKPVYSPWLDRVRNNRLPMPLRKAMVAWYLWRRDGVFSDWVEGSRPYWSILAEHFKPDVIWGTFIHVDTWVVAQGIARKAGIPWVMDVKDGWDSFIPSPLRSIVARRFRDAVAITVNSQYQSELTRRWFHQQPVVVYSGVPSCFLNRPPIRLNADEYRITLVGGTYYDKNLYNFMEGVRNWLTTLSPTNRTKVIFSYAGGERDKISRATQTLEGMCKLEINGYLSLNDLFNLCSRSMANAYLWSPKGFHHKLIELICCARPIIAFSGERPETFDLVRHTGAMLFVCENYDNLSAVLRKLVEDPPMCSLHLNKTAVAQFSWESQADRLIGVLGHAARDAI